MRTATTTIAARLLGSVARPVRPTALAWSWPQLVLWWPRAVRPVTG
jgi:hypothetical protein